MIILITLINHFSFHKHNTSWLKQTSDETKRMAFRLYWAWILVEFIGETDPGSLAAKYSLDRGNVEVLLF